MHTFIMINNYPENTASLRENSFLFDYTKKTCNNMDIHHDGSAMAHGKDKVTQSIPGIHILNSYWDCAYVEVRLRRVLR